MDRAFAEDIAGAAPPEHFLLFSGFDLWRAGGFAHGGALWSPDGLDREGFTLKLLLGAGGYHFRSATTEISAHQGLAAAMPGWRFKGDHFEGSVFAGPDLQSHHFIPDDPANRLRGTKLGVRVGGDVWFQPSDWAMLTAAASVSTLGSSMWSRAAAGVRVFDWAWFGPELHAMGDGRYWQLRAGLHVTALRTGEFEWSVGFGLARDSDQRAGAYGRIGVLTRR